MNGLIILIFSSTPEPKVLSSTTRVKAEYTLYNEAITHYYNTGFPQSNAATTVPCGLALFDNALSMMLENV